MMLQEHNQDAPFVTSFKTIQITLHCIISSLFNPLTMKMLLAMAKWHTLFDKPLLLGHFYNQRESADFLPSFACALHQI